MLVILFVWMVWFCVLADCNVIFLFAIEYHGLKLRQDKLSLDIRKHFFTKGVVKH